MALSALLVRYSIRDTDLARLTLTIPERSKLTVGCIIYATLWEHSHAFDDTGIWAIDGKALPKICVDCTIYRHGNVPARYRDWLDSHLGKDSPMAWGTHNEAIEQARVALASDKQAQENARREQLSRDVATMRDLLERHGLAWGMSAMGLQVVDKGESSGDDRLLCKATALQGLVKAFRYADSLQERGEIEQYHLAMADWFNRLADALAKATETMRERKDSEQE